jgi:uncharacterized protein
MKRALRRVSPLYMLFKARLFCHLRSVTINLENLNEAYIMGVIPFLLTGFLAGILSGIFGVGGGIIIIPMLTFLLKMPQHSATGTSLIALLLPVGALAVWEYYSQGKISSDNIRWGLLIAAGLFFGALVGAKVALLLPEQLLRRAFAVLMMLVAIKMWFKI